MASGRSEKRVTRGNDVRSQDRLPTDYAPQVLEAFDNKHRQRLLR